MRKIVVGGLAAIAATVGIGIAVAPAPHANAACLPVVYPTAQVDKCYGKRVVILGPGVNV